MPEDTLLSRDWIDALAVVNDNTRSSTISSQVCIWQHITSGMMSFICFLKVSLQMSFRVVLNTDKEEWLLVKTLFVFWFVFFLGEGSQADMYRNSLFSVGGDHFHKLKAFLWYNKGKIPYFDRLKRN